MNKSAIFTYTHAREVLSKNKGVECECIFHFQEILITTAFTTTSHRLHSVMAWLLRRNRLVNRSIEIHCFRKIKYTLLHNIVMSTWRHTFPISSFVNYLFLFVLRCHSYFFFISWINGIELDFVGITSYLYSLKQIHFHHNINRQAFSGILLKCFDMMEIARISNEIHNRIPFSFRSTRIRSDKYFLIRVAFKMMHFPIDH